jgi:hypothetical protein
MEKPTLRSRIFSCIIFSLACSLSALFVTIVLAAYIEMLIEDFNKKFEKYITEVKENEHPLHDWIRRRLSSIRRMF